MNESEPGPIKSISGKPLSASTGYLVLFISRHYSWTNHRMGPASSQVHGVTSSYLPFLCPSLPSFPASVALFAIIFLWLVSTVTSAAACPPWGHHSYRDLYGILFLPWLLSWLAVPLCQSDCGVHLSALRLWVFHRDFTYLWNLVDPGVF